VTHVALISVLLHAICDNIIRRRTLMWFNSFYGILDKIKRIFVSFLINYMFSFTSN